VFVDTEFKFVNKILMCKNWQLANYCHRLTKNKSNLKYILIISGCPCQRSTYDYYYCNSIVSLYGIRNFFFHDDFEFLTLIVFKKLPNLASGRSFPFYSFQHLEHFLGKIFCCLNGSLCDKSGKKGPLHKFGL
jgi:hypothetical protein